MATYNNGGVCKADQCPLDITVHAVRVSGSRTAHPLIVVSTSKGLLKHGQHVFVLCQHLGMGITNFAIGMPDMMLVCQICLRYARYA